MFDHFSNGDTDLNDLYDVYEAEFDPMKSDRKVRRQRKPKVKHNPKKSQAMILEDIVDDDGIETGFQTTYKPGKYEAGWLLESLTTFYSQKLIVDVLTQVKGGKEASVYLCEAHPNTGFDYLAAKVYRPRQFRQLSNDQMYREGRAVLTETGTAVKETDHRVLRAIGKKSAFGQQVAHTSWLMYEFTTMQSLLNMGAAVPQVIAAGENAILMDYLGDENIAAPTLSQMRLDLEEAAPLFDEVMRNVELMLANGLIHGDLSAYNILYWAGEITLIDFPQVTMAERNSNAYDIFARDVTRICEYFAAQGLHRDPEAITRRLWKRYVERPYHEQMADLSRLEAQEEE
ncbi:MAG: RIO1 family regulatory kinase/ATPase [bacterium]|nr:RIO1 family regulatory kinase/ATPase [bacterium]